MKTKFKIGDIVKLKCGGPKMVISYVAQDWTGDYYCCKYFNFLGEMCQEQSIKGDTLCLAGSEDSGFVSRCVETEMDSGYRQK